ncbi:MAG: hypothetical protein A2X86_14400 [Bdellovibrionales bacterium GWA2_49_15]|nr:MAG: hypothetical protein A2X86_14400 [Bdellovibrionales bacterium GWA2_49_15]HAZ13841.1 hypothetical protein [Bdellovibrionales bacterium]
MKLSIRKTIEDVSLAYHIPTEVIIFYIKHEWIYPIDRENLLLDEEDIARIHLINELREDFGVNDDAIPIILHLIDQLNYFRVR